MTILVKGAFLVFMSELVEIAPGVHESGTEVSIGLGARLPLRMTVLACEGGVAIVSPIAIDDALAEAIDALGPVRYLLAPNLLHHMHLQSASKRYPEAKVLGAPGLATKRSDLRFDGELGDGEITPELESHLVRGADKLSEVVFFHRPSKTLVVTDLVFNIHGARGMSGLVLSMLSRALGKVEQSRLLRWMTKDRAAAGKSVDTLLDLPFERLVMAHGNVVEHGAKAELSAGTWWMRGEARRPAA